MRVCKRSLSEVQKMPTLDKGSASIFRLGKICPVIFLNRLTSQLVMLVTCLITLSFSSPASPQESPKLQLTRPVHSWEFLCAVGKRAGIFGNESGTVEGWVYPLKLFRNFSITVHTDGRAIAAANLARSISVQPEAVTILYAGDTFSIRETFFVPVDESGALIQFDVESEKPLELEASFQRDFQLEWPAAIGGSYSNWDERIHSFVFGEESHRFSGILGSPTAEITASEFDTNYASSSMSGFRLGVSPKGKDTKIIALAGSVKGRADAELTLQKLFTQAQLLRTQAEEYYAQYLRRTVSVELPDQAIQQAYDWSRISVLQGLVSNPTLGTGLVAGYRTSGDGQRPGFAWFFGRDAYWTSFALNSEGDFGTTRAALKFIIQFQREDGRIPHEIAQGASFVNWFKDYPYGFASADATPLYIIAMNDYVTASGDLDFARENWNSVWKAYEFLLSTYDGGFPKNFGVGHGWVEGGPLLPVKSELYQTGVAVEALRSLAALCERVGRSTEAKTIAADADKQQSQMNDSFWSPERKHYGFALDTDSRRVEELSVLGTVPMWFGLLDSDKSRATIQQLSSLEHSSDWGMRIISNSASMYSGGGYHFGSVWPLFTGWAAVGAYRYHQVHPAYDNLRANALLALDGSPGHVTEVLSGDYYQPLSTSSPHQIWSAAMVISPILRGLFGLQTDAFTQTITLAPSLPADWDSFALTGIAAGKVTASIRFRRTADEMEADIRRTGSGDCLIEFQPAISLRAEVLGVQLNGRPLSFRVQSNGSDQHILLKFNASGGPNLLKIRLRDDFSLSYSRQLPPYGHTSEDLRILSESWSEKLDRLTLLVEGAANHTYELALRNSAQVSKAEGADILKPAGIPSRARITLAGQEGGASVRQTVVFYFPAKSPAPRSKP